MHTPAGEDGRSSPSNVQVELSDDVSTTVYDVLPRGTMPVFDPSVRIKTLVVPPKYDPRVDAISSRYAKPIGIAYAVGFVCRGLTFVVPVDLAQWTALVSVPLQVPAVAIVIFHFRVEFLKLLVRTYDFWYYLAMNAVWAACLAWYFSDYRIAIIPIMWIDVQNATLLDSFFQDFHVIVYFTWVWCVFLAAAMVAISMDAVDGIGATSVLLVTKHRTVTVKEVLLNAIGTTVVLLARVMYRKRAAMRSQEKSFAERTVESITFTWPLMLQQRARDLSSSSGKQWQVQRQICTPTGLQLQLSHRSKPLLASDIVAPSQFMWIRRHAWLLRVIRILGIVGFTATPTLFCVDRDQDGSRLVLALAAFLGTPVYCTKLVCFYQRTLLAQLVFSFDFAFISLQLTTVHLCVADAFRWETAETLCIASSWMWIHLVMTLDALTPVVRRTLGFSLWFQLPVLLLLKVASLLLFLELILWDSQGLQDRLFFHASLGHRSVQFHVVPFLLSRLLTVSLWGLRIFYRAMTKASDHDLLFVRSHVEYDALFQRKRRHVPRRSRISPTFGLIASPTQSRKSRIEIPRPVDQGSEKSIKILLKGAFCK